MSALPFVARLIELVEDGLHRDGSLPPSSVRELLAALDGLKHDLQPRPTGVRCGTCGQRFDWPGQLDNHLHRVHGEPWRDAA